MGPFGLKERASPPAKVPGCGALYRKATLGSMLPSEMSVDAKIGTIRPAAAVIPAPVAYIQVVAVKKLVVGSRVGDCGPLVIYGLGLRPHQPSHMRCHKGVAYVTCTHQFYFE